MDACCLLVVARCMARAREVQMRDAVHTRAVRNVHCHRVTAICPRIVPDEERSGEDDNRRGCGFHPFPMRDQLYLDSSADEVRPAGKAALFYMDVKGYGAKTVVHHLGAADQIVWS